MRLVLFTNQYPAPRHTFIRREVEALEARGHDLLRYSLRSFEGELAGAAERREQAATRVVLGSTWRTPLALGWALAATSLRHPVLSARALLRALDWGGPSRWHALAYLAEAAWLARAWRASKTDHVRVHFGTNPLTVAALARLLGGPPFSVTLHGNEPFRAPWQASLAARLQLARLTFAVSEVGAKRLAQLEPTPCVELLRCGLEASFLQAESPPPPPTGPVVFVGALTAAKGADVLLEAALELLDAGLSFELEFLGDGPLRVELEQRSKAAGQAEAVRFRGWCSSDEVRETLLRARALALPSLAEGLPTVIMEAFALGRPVLATRVGGVDELLEDGKSGWLLPPGDGAALKCALSALVRCSPDELHERGKHGRQRVLRNHDAARQAQRLEQLMSDAE